MPSPIGHSLIGLSIVLAWLPAGKFKEYLLPLLGILFMAVFADIDLVAGAFTGDLNSLHRQATHSLPVAVLASLLAWCMLSTFQRRAEWRFFGLFFIAACSHLFADWLGDDGKAPYGIMLWWPFSEAYTVSPVPIFPQLRKADLADMFSRSNLLPMVQETAIVLSLLAVVFLIRRRRPAARACPAVATEG